MCICSIFDQFYCGCQVFLLHSSVRYLFGGNMTIKKISKYVTVNSGRSFRGAIKSAKNSTHKVVQIGDIEFKNNKPVIAFETLIETDLQTTRQVTCLENGQVVIVAKGNEKHVILLGHVPENVVCTQHFLVLTPKKSEGITSEFLYYFLSSESSKNWIESNAGGSYQSSISKGTLEKLPFPELSLEQQQTYIDLSVSVELEVDLHQKMIAVRQAQLNGALDELMEKLNDE